jgi:hypothetical protein
MMYCLRRARFENRTRSDTNFKRRQVMGDYFPLALCVTSHLRRKFAAASTLFSHCSNACTARDRSKPKAVSCVIWSSEGGAIAGPMPPKESKRSRVASVHEGILARSNSAPPPAPDSVGGALVALLGGGGIMNEKMLPTPAKIFSTKPGSLHACILK